MIQPSVYNSLFTLRIMDEPKQKLMRQRCTVGRLFYVVHPILKSTVLFMLGKKFEKIRKRLTLDAEYRFFNYYSIVSKFIYIFKEFEILFKNFAIKCPKDKKK